MRWWLATMACLLIGVPGALLADESAVRRQVETRLSNSKVLEVRKLRYGDLYEVVLRNAQGVRVIYTDSDAKVFVIGSLIDSTTGDNLTEARLRKLTAIDWGTLPFDSAITMTRGSGRREIAIFSDPNCPYCQHFERDLAKLDDITVHIFMYPVIRPDSVRLTKAVWCSKDRVKAWNDLMLQRIEPTAKPDCDTPVEKLVALGHKLGAASTPTWFLRNGEMYKDAMPMEDVVRLLDETAEKR